MYGTGLLKGMGITIRRLFMKTTTEFYPYVKPELPKRSRIMLKHNVNEDGKPVCIACKLCERGCPDQVIRITQDPEDRKKCKQYLYYAGRCTFCGLCAEACPYDAITFSQDFEKASYANRGEKGLIFEMIKDGEIVGEDDNNA
ncbi:MAG: 4Fe-4S binding protein [Candidatus Aquicultorales bacterium]